MIRDDLDQEPVLNKFSNMSLKNSDIETTAKNILQMLTSDDPENNSPEFYDKLEKELYALHDLLYEITSVKLISNNDLIGDCFLKLDKFACNYYSQLIRCVIDRVDDINWFDRSPSNIPGCVIKLIVIDNATVEILHESLVTMCEIIKSFSVKSSKLDIALKLLEYFLKCCAVQSAYYDIHRDNCYRINDLSLDNPTGKNYVLLENRKQMWNDAIQMFVSLPDRVANKLNGKFPDIFVRDNFSSLCCYHIAKCVKFLALLRKRDENNRLYVQCLSKFFSKVLCNFNGCNSLKNLIKVFYSWCYIKTDLMNHYRHVIQILFASLDSISVEIAAMHVLNYCSESELVDICGLLGENIIEFSGWYHVLLYKIPLMSYKCDVKAIETLVYYLGNVQCYRNILFKEKNVQFSPDKINLLSDLFLQLITVWCDKTAITHSTVEQHLYISKIIILSCRFITKRFTYNNSLEVNLEKLLRGIPVHLDSTSEMIRAIGMVTADCVINNINSLKLNNAGSSKNDVAQLEFDYTGMTDDLLVVVNDLKELNRYDFLIETPKTIKSNINLDLSNDESLRNFLNCCLESKINSNNIDKDKKIIDFWKTVNTNSAEINEDETLDSDDDLVPYDLSNDVKILETKQPKYLRELIINIVETNDRTDPDVWIASIKACEKLVYSQLPNDDASLGLELMDILLSLNMKFYCDNFEEIKYGAALAIVIVYPSITAEYICKKFHEDNKYSISQKCFMLDILSGAAKILSDPSYSNNKKSEVKMDMLVTQIPVKSNWAEIVKERINSKTRRFHRPSIPKGKKNKFSDVAGSFLFPLLRGKGDKHPGIMFSVNSKTTESLEDSLFLLVRILHTCSVIMACSVNCHAAFKMAKELLEATWSLRFHSEVKIKEEIIGCIAAVVLAVPKSLLQNDMFCEIIEAKKWLEQIVFSQHVGILKNLQSEIDFKCKSFADQVIKLIDCTIFSDN